MAKKSDTDNYMDDITVLRSLVRDYEKIVGRVDPSKILERLPEPCTGYNADLPQRVLVLASLGMFPKEVRAELGMTLGQWREYRTKYAEFHMATERGKDIAAAHWSRRAREAITAKDWKFPFANMQQMIKTQQEDDSEADRGDASQLVIFNADKGRQTIAAKAGKPS